MVTEVIQVIQDPRPFPAPPLTGISSCFQVRYHRLKCTITFVYFFLIRQAATSAWNSWHLNWGIYLKEIIQDFEGSTNRKQRQAPDKWMCGTRTLLLRQIGLRELKSQSVHCPSLTLGSLDIPSDLTAHSFTSSCASSCTLNWSATYFPSYLLPSWICRCFFWPTDTSLLTWQKAETNTLGSQALGSTEHRGKTATSHPQAQEKKMRFPKAVPGLCCRCV